MQCSNIQLVRPNNTRSTQPNASDQQHHPTLYSLPLSFTSTEAPVACCSAARTLLPAPSAPMSRSYGTGWGLPENVACSVRAYEWRAHEQVDCVMQQGFRVLGFGTFLLSPPPPRHDTVFGETDCSSVGLTWGSRVEATYHAYDTIHLLSRHPPPAGH